jgi:hypothetical protein
MTANGGEPHQSRHGRTGSITLRDVARGSGVLIITLSRILNGCKTGVPSARRPAGG